MGEPRHPEVNSIHPVVKWLDSHGEGEIRSVLDLGCGDLSTMASCHAVASGEIRYFGVDCQAGLIRHHLRNFTWFRGVVVDVEGAPLLMRDLMRCDVVLAIGILEMLCNGSAETVLSYINRGAWRWLLVSSAPGADNSRRRGLRMRQASKPLDVQALGILRDQPVEILEGGFLVYHRTPIPATERFFILCRELNSRAARLADQLAPFGEVVIIEDTGEETPGFNGITNLPKSVTAWDRAFVGIDPSRPAWFIEDDVACRDWRPVISAGAAAGVDLVAMDCATREQDPDWPWWPRDAAAPRIAKSFNPICRLSAALIQRVLAYRAARGAFSFHEIMFASLADSTFDMRREITQHIGTFRWRPEVTTPAAGRLQHPVKDDAVHAALS